ncbi:hypothetical protein HDV00_010204 [Rhizophlyctis rosea]|nr:hypothetical protein HDV00_010204 [Rhizophlyctis rosea]
MSIIHSQEEQHADAISDRIVAHNAESRNTVPGPEHPSNTEMERPSDTATEVSANPPTPAEPQQAPTDPKVASVIQFLPAPIPPENIDLDKRSALPTSHPTTKVPMENKMVDLLAAQLMSQTTTTIQAEVAALEPSQSSTMICASTADEVQVRRSAADMMADNSQMGMKDRAYLAALEAEDGNGEFLASDGTRSSDTVDLPDSFTVKSQLDGAVDKVGQVNDVGAEDSGESGIEVSEHGKSADDIESHRSKTVIEDGQALSPGKGDGMVGVQGVEAEVPRQASVRELGAQDDVDLPAVDASSTPQPIPEDHDAVKHLGAISDEGQSPLSSVSLEDDKATNAVSPVDLTETAAVISSEKMVFVQSDVHVEIPAPVLNKVTVEEDTDSSIVQETGASPLPVGSRPPPVHPVPEDSVRTSGLSSHIPSQLASSEETPHDEAVELYQEDDTDSTSNDDNIISTSEENGAYSNPNNEDITFTSNENNDAKSTSNGPDQPTSTDNETNPDTQASNK